MTDATTSRSIVRHGIAEYLGGTWVENIRAYQNGPLTSAGLGTVRAGYTKRLDMQDFWADMPPGTQMGAVMAVQLVSDNEVRRAMAGVPETDSNDDIIAGGWKMITYQVTLDCYHVAQADHAEDAVDAVDDLIEAIKEQIRYDRTLGGICMDAGESRRGIQVDVGEPGMDANERVLTWFTIKFECRVNMLA